MHFFYCNFFTIFYIFQTYDFYNILSKTIQKYKVKRHYQIFDWAYIIILCGFINIFIVRYVHRFAPISNNFFIFSHFIILFFFFLLLLLLLLTISLFLLFLWFIFLLLLLWCTSWRLITRRIRWWDSCWLIGRWIIR